VQSKALNGLDSLLSIVQMPGGVPVATMAIGKAGATNAALFAARILGVADEAIAKAVHRHMTEQTQAVVDNPDPFDSDRNEPGDRNKQAEESE
jgi:5-(carboxyamino)imidazole ribonucleotide mutase